MPAQSPERAGEVWLIWEPFLVPPPGHPLTGEHALRDVVLAALLPAYKTKTAGTNAAKVLLDSVGDTIHVEIFRQFTVEDLVDEMAVNPHVISPVHTILSQHKRERHSSTPHFTGVRLLPPRPPFTERESAYVQLTLQLRSTTSERGQGQDTQPGPPIAPHRLILMGTQTPRESQCVTEMFNRGLHLAHSSPAQSSAREMPRHEGYPSNPSSTYPRQHMALPLIGGGGQRSPPTKPRGANCPTSIYSINRRLDSSPPHSHKRRVRVSSGFANGQRLHPVLRCLGVCLTPALPNQTIHIW